jgi:hypothetical protein
VGSNEEDNNVLWHSLFALRFMQICTEVGLFDSLLSSFLGLIYYMGGAAVD